MSIVVFSRRCELTIHDNTFVSDEPGKKLSESVAYTPSLCRNMTPAGILWPGVKVSGCKGTVNH